MRTGSFTILGYPFSVGSSTMFSKSSQVPKETLERLPKISSKKPKSFAPFPQGESGNLIFRLKFHSRSRIFIRVWNFPISINILENKCLPYC
jgi:hypothetical protein